MKICVIIAAGGTGTRMKKTGGKQFLKIAGKPMLLWTLEVFEAAKVIDDIILVVDGKKLAQAQTLVKAEKLIKVKKVVAGGNCRQVSVFNGLKAIDFKCDIVLVHDGARPMVEKAEIKAVIKGVTKCGAAIAASPVKDTLKRVKGSYILNSPPRDVYWEAKTPQGFKFDLLKHAHMNAQKKNIKATDDSMLVEALGGKIKIIKASCYNIKVTTPEDQYVAESILIKK